MAKTARVSRKNIIQPDHFISSSDIIIAYCSKHKAKLFTIAISLILLVFLGTGIFFSRIFSSARDKHARKIWGFLKK